MSAKKVVKRARPAWLLEFRKRTAIIEIIDLAFEIDCDCEVCQKLREVAHELEDVFIPKSPR